MRNVRDIATELQSIHPSAAESYLRLYGWEYDDNFREIESYWQTSDGKQHTTLPLRPEARDFSLRMSEFVDTVALVEQRSAMDVISDLQTANMDVVSFRVNTGSEHDGAIPLKNGVQLFESARDALISAARATVESRPLFQGGAPGEVSRYLEKVKVGQTEHGSYIVNLLSPVATLTQNTQREGQAFPDTEYDREVNFPRSVTRMLRKALRSTQEAAEESAHDPEYRAFVNAIHSGVSANLCEALLRIHESGGDRGIQVNLRWAYTLPPDDQQEETFDFDSEYIPVLRGAAEVLRATDPHEDYLLLGDVTELRRDALLQTGQIVVKAKVDDAVRKVQVDLESQDYDEAVMAHKEGVPIRVKGRLRQKGIKWILENPKDLRVLEDRPLLDLPDEA